MRQSLLGLLSLLVLTGACALENQTSLPPLRDPGRPNVGDPCRLDEVSVVPNAGCGRCRETFLLCSAGVWDCVYRPGAPCTPVAVLDASVDASLEASVTDAVTVTPDVDRPDAAGPEVAAADVMRDVSVEAAADVTVSAYACPMDRNPEGSPCSNYAGACLRTGTWRCDVPTGWRRCVSPPSGIPMPEVCDGIDNDCNGLIDDAIPSHSCYGGVPETLGHGVTAICRRGTQSCVAGQWGACVGEVRPQPVETCGNAFDDDCDGRLNQGCCGNLGFTPDPCARGVGACRRAGTMTCLNGQVQCSAVAGTAGPVEICANLVDDNCNGRTDESPCTVPAPP